MNESEGFKIEVGVDTEAAKGDFDKLASNAQRLTKQFGDGFKSVFAKFRSGFKGFSMPKSGGAMPKGWREIGKVVRDGFKGFSMPKSGGAMPKGGLGIGGIAKVTGALSAMAVVAGKVTAGLALFGAGAAAATAAVVGFAYAFKNTQAFIPIAAEFSRFEESLRVFKNTLVSGLFDMLSKFKVFDFFADVINKSTEQLSFFLGVMTEACDAFGAFSLLPDWVGSVMRFVTKSLATVGTFAVALANTISQACKMIYHAVTFQWGKLGKDTTDWLDAQEKFAGIIRDIWTNPDRFRTEARDASGSMRFVSRGTFSGAEAQSMGYDIQQQQLGVLREVRNILERIHQMPIKVII